MAHVMLTMAATAAYIVNYMYLLFSALITTSTSECSCAVVLMYHCTCKELPTFFTGGTGDKKPAKDVTFAKDERRFFFGSY